jgi:hypothetical protein
MQPGASEMVRSTIDILVHVWFYPRWRERIERLARWCLGRPFSEGEVSTLAANDAARSRATPGSVGNPKRASGTSKRRGLGTLVAERSWCRWDPLVGRMMLVAALAALLLGCFAVPKAGAKVLAKSVDAGSSPLARASARHIVRPRELRYRITASPRAWVEVQVGVGCEGGPSFSTNWENLTALPKIERRVKLPLRRPVRCSLSVYAHYKGGQRGRIEVMLTGRLGRPKGAQQR